MSLFDKLRETKFKDLKYGNGFGGGNYSEPIITEPIPVGDNRGLITTIPQAATKNRNRISKVFKLPRGTQFDFNQKILDLQNVKLEGYLGSPRITKTYNSNNTLLQAGASNIGFHYPRNFGEGVYNSRDLIDNVYKYESLVKDNNSQGFNRLENLYKKFEVGSLKTESNYNFVSNLIESGTNFLNTLGVPNTLGLFANIRAFSDAYTNFNNAKRDLKGLPRRQGVNKVNNWFKKADFNIKKVISSVSTVASYYPLGDSSIDSYLAGPSGGVTNLRRVTYTNDLKKKEQILELASNNLLQKRNLLDGRFLPITQIFQELGDVSANLGTDYENKTEISNSVYEKSNKTIVGTNEETKNKKQTFYDGNKYVLKSPQQLAKVGNNISWIRNKANDGSELTNGKVSAYNDNTIDNRMPIIFTIIDPFTGDESRHIKFSAYLNNFRDTTSPNWNSTSYIGRSEFFYTYSKFSRQVSFNFQIPCFNLIELDEKHDELSRLYTSTMGQYNDNKLGGIIHRVKIGRYLNHQPGVITNISYSIPDNASWDVDQELAHNIDVSVTFNVIHDFLPSYNNSAELFKVVNIKPTNNQFNPLLGNAFLDKTFSNYDPSLGNQTGNFLNSGNTQGFINSGLNYLRNDLINKPTDRISKWAENQAAKQFGKLFR